ncbi:MAG: transporter substrate-binding domain-containing protein [Desulfobacteraceae bacterium]|nr:transporter substrate-binding domain-containing protein [Desulfobacteraceae bacterium]
MIKTILSAIPGLVLTILFISPLFSPLLNAQENKAKTQVFTGASSNNFPPMNLLDKDGNLKGFGCDLSDAVMKAVGVEIRHIHSSHWNEVLEWLDSGEADFIHDTGYTEARDKFLDYSKPIIEMPEMIFVRSDQYDITGLNSLKGKKVACVNKHISHLYLQKFPEISCYVVKTPVEGLYELISKKVDAFVYPKQIVLYLAQNLRLTDKIKTTGDPLRSLTWSMVVKDGNKELLTLLNDGIDKVRISGEYDRIYDRWWGKRALAGYSEHELRIITSIVVVISIAFVSLIALILYSYKLRSGKKILEREISQRKHAEKELRESEERFDLAMKFANDGIVDWNIKTNEIYYSPGWKKMIGYEDHEIKNKPSEWKRLTKPEDIKASQKMLNEVLERKRERFEKEFKMLHKDGHWVDVLARANVIFDEKDKGIRLVGTHVDITDLKRMEAELRQAQKMESVGRLAGGVAHDFNNMLSVILGNTEMILEDADTANPFINNLQEIHKATKRSIDLTQQLLAFARKQTIAPKVLDLNKTIEGMLRMLRRLIGENIDLAWIPRKNLYTVKIDPSQIDQVMANLCVNARDSIKGVGKITIETNNISFDENYCHEHDGFKPGEFVMIAVSDNGCGMGTEILDNLFEPFFTTKDVSKGTGLGLATVYGIIKQNKGFINVYSEPDKGTSFKIYLPVHAGKVLKAQKQKAKKEALGGFETILLVEDEESILKMTTMMLERLGYSVLATSSPAKAIDSGEAHSGKINLLMTDVVMPEMNGRELAKKLLSRFPNLKCLFMSGYTANVIAHHGVLDEEVQFIQKPFSQQDLAIKVREVLDTDKI